MGYFSQNNDSSLYNDLNHTTGELICNNIYIKFIKDVHLSKEEYDMI
jgi:hypothetical protein